MAKVSQLLVNVTLGKLDLESTLREIKDGDDGTLPYSPWLARPLADLLPGMSEADLFRICNARLAFGSLLMRSPRYQRGRILLYEMTQLAGIGNQLERIQHAITTNAPYRPQARASPAPSAIQQLREILERVDNNKLEALLWDFVRRELKCPWHWLADDLLMTWYCTVQMITAKQSIAVTEEIVSRVQETPRIEYTFQPRPGETPAAMRDRLLQETEAISESLKHHQATLPKGRRRDDVLIRNVEWFFRRRVLGESKRHISRFDIEGRDLGLPFSWPLVHASINQVEDILSVDPTQ